MKKIKQLEPMEIEKRSFEIISHELSDMQITLPADQEMITKRVKIGRASCRERV